MSSGKFINITGQKFGLLVALKPLGKNKNGEICWKCRCECGKYTIVSGCSLRKNKGTKSCGCKEGNHIHGMRHTPEYNVWSKIKNRCNNPKSKDYKYYGGRGIKVYPKWIKSFQAFFDYVGPRPTPKHTIERIDNDKGYFPGNVTWATQTEQANNTRTNHPITIGKLTLNLCQWAQKLGINQTTICQRINAGWSPEKAVLQSIRQHKPYKPYKKWNKKDKH